MRVKLTYLQPDQIRSMLHPTLLPYVTFDKNSGTVTVTAPEPMREHVLSAIKTFDQPNRQVVIEATVFELTQEGSKDLAMDWKFRAGKFGAQSENLVNGVTYDSRSDLGTYVDASLRAIVESRKGQVLANPRVVVVSNTEAEIFVGQEKYFSLLSGQATNPYYTLQSIKAGVTLKVTPYIGEEGEITLNLEPEVSDVVADQVQGAGNAQNAAAGMPVVTRRHAKTTVQVRDGQTVFLGGLLRAQHRSTVDKVPVMGDLPGVGAAFRSVKDAREEQEVVILITANIVDNTKSQLEAVTPRLEKRYVSPLDAVTAQ
jgi:type II secretory pathway component GspD/PulD (secretin)